MTTERIIVDGHIHIFNRIAGRMGTRTTHGLPFGRIQVGDGEVIQFMPPFKEETSFPADVIVAMMDFAGVSKGVLLQNPVIGTVNEEIAAAIARYPDRLIGSIQVDPRDPHALATIKHYGANPKQQILKFEMSDGWGWSGIHSGLRLDDDCFTPIWRFAAANHFPVIIDPGRPNNAGYQVEIIQKLAVEYSDITFVLEHLGAMNRENWHRKDRWDEMINLGKLSNVYLGVASIGAGLREEYPCPLALGLLKESVERVGAEKLIWGTDTPSNMKFYTYRQMAEMFIDHADFLSEAEKDRLMGGNALRVYGRF